MKYLLLLLIGLSSCVPCKQSSTVVNKSRVDGGTIKKESLPVKGKGPSVIKSNPKKFYTDQPQKRIRVRGDITKYNY